MMLIALNSPPNMVALAALILRMHFVTFANPRQMHAILCAALCYAGLGLTAPGLTGLIRLGVLRSRGQQRPRCWSSHHRSGWSWCWHSDRSPHPLRNPPGHKECAGSSGMERHPRLPRPVRLGRLSIDLVIFAPVFLMAKPSFAGITKMMNVATFYAFVALIAKVLGVLTD